MERKTKTINFATKRTKVKSVYKVLKPKQAVLIFLGALGALVAILGFKVFLSTSPPLRLSVEAFDFLRIG